MTPMATSAGFSALLTSVQDAGEDFEWYTPSNVRLLSGEVSA